MLRVAVQATTAKSYVKKQTAELKGMVPSNPRWGTSRAPGSRSTRTSLAPLAVESDPGASTDLQLVLFEEVFKHR